MRRVDKRNFLEKVCDAITGREQILGHDYDEVQVGISVQEGNTSSGKLVMCLGEPEPKIGHKFKEPLHTTMGWFHHTFYGVKVIDKEDSASGSIVYTFKADRHERKLIKT